MLARRSLRPLHLILPLGQQLLQQSATCRHLLFRELCDQSLLIMLRLEVLEFIRFPLRHTDDFGWEADKFSDVDAEGLVANACSSFSFCVLPLVEEAKWVSYHLQLYTAASLPVPSLPGHPHELRRGDSLLPDIPRPTP